MNLDLNVIGGVAAAAAGVLMLGQAAAQSMGRASSSFSTVFWFVLAVAALNQATYWFVTDGGRFNMSYAVVSIVLNLLVTCYIAFEIVTSRR